METNGNRDAPEAETLGEYISALRSPLSELDLTSENLYVFFFPVPFRIGESGL